MTSHLPDEKPGSVTTDIGSLDMTNAHPRSGEAGPSAVTAAGSGQATMQAGLVNPGAVLGLAALVAAAGSLALLGRAGAAISFPPAGSIDLARERGPGSAGTVARRGR